jgi:hypothetical protein
VRDEEDANESQWRGKK